MAAHLENSVTNKRMQSICEEHPTDITKFLQSLVEREFFVTNNKAGRGTVYYINKAYKLNSIDNGNNSVDNNQNLFNDEVLMKRLKKPGRKRGYHQRKCVKLLLMHV